MCFLVCNKVHSKNNEAELLFFFFCDADYVCDGDGAGVALCPCANRSAML